MTATAEVKIPKGMQVVKCRVINGKMHTRLMDARYKEWQCHLVLFGLHQHGEDKLFHFHRFVELCWPDPIFIWDEWCDLYFGALSGAKETVERVSGEKIETNEKWWLTVIATGAASTGKSAKAALWIFANWIVAQADTTCIITSTSMDALKARIWACLMTWATNSVVQFPMEVLPSELEFRWSAKDAKGVITGIAVKSGSNVAMTVDTIKGRHNKRVFVIVDEMTAVSDAIVVAGQNLSSGTKEYQFIGLGNARDHNDPHGRRSEPLNGWGSITVNSKIWLTKYGVAIHFDCIDSPGMRDPERYHFYPNAEWLKRQANEQGGDNSPEFWSGCRGFWPPSGLSNKVFDQAILDQFKASDAAIWKGNDWKICGAFDFAEFGDRRILYPFKFGTFPNGIKGIEFLEPIVVTVDSSTEKRNIYYAIAHSLMAHCEALKIRPEDFIMDTTGAGSGFFNILSGIWSNRIRACNFSGAAEKTQIAPDRPTTYFEIYTNKVTAMWFRLRRYVEGEQVRGLRDPETIRELCARDREMRGGKIAVIPKDKMKGFGHNSPDKADAAACAAQYLYDVGVAPSGMTGGGQQSMERWDELVAAQADDSEDYSASPEEEYA